MNFIKCFKAQLQLMCFIELTCTHSKVQTGSIKNHSDYSPKWVFRPQKALQRFFMKTVPCRIKYGLLRTRFGFNCKH